MIGVPADDILQSIEIRTPATGDFWDIHEHARHELLSSITASITVTTRQAVHVLPRGAAIWLPAHCPHAVRARPGNVMRCSWFAAHLLPHPLTRPTVLTTSSLLDAVLAHLGQEEGPDRRARAEAFALDLLSLDARPDDGLPQPDSADLRRVTAALADRPGHPRSVAQWAAGCSVSERTFTRRFTAETGVSFSAWRSRLRVQAAMAELAVGTPVGTVARAVGFESTSAFVTAFRRQTGVTPAAFARGARTVPADRSEQQLVGSAQ